LGYKKIIILGTFLIASLAFPSPVNEANRIIDIQQRQLEQERVRQQQEKMQPITTKLVNAIKAVGKAGGYVYIMDTSAGIPYISTTLSKDVTADVKAQLNKMK